MKVSEEKARQSRCPHATRGPDGLMGHCVASQCMMWRWAYDFSAIPAPNNSSNIAREEFAREVAARYSQGFEVYADLPSELRLRKKLTVGFCGLAGNASRDGLA